MKDVFKGILTGFWFTNDIYEDSYNLLILHNRRIVAEHSREVAEECKRLAKRFGVNEQLADILDYENRVNKDWGNQNGNANTYRSSGRNNRK